MALRPDKEQKLSLTYMDYGGEKSSATFYGDELTAANFDAAIAEADALVTAVNNITIGKLVRREDGVDTDVEADMYPPTDKDAQRESKLAVYYIGTVTGHRGSLEIPTFDLSKLANNTERPAKDPATGEYTDAQIQAFVDAFELFQIMPDPISGGGQTVTVVDLVYVGRNL